MDATGVARTLQVVREFLKNYVCRKPSKIGLEKLVFGREYADATFWAKKGLKKAVFGGFLGKCSTDVHPFIYIGS